MTGCTKISPGCAHCYAEAITLRFKRGGPFLPGKTTIQLHEDRLMIPLRWQRPRCIFTCSMSDLFHEDVSDDFIAVVFAVMAASQRHIFPILTKRPERALAWFEWFPSHYDGPRRNDLYDQSTPYLRRALKEAPEVPWPLPNVWLGVSVENQRWADIRIPLLLQTPAAVRFLSMEPLLKRVFLKHDWLTGRMKPVSMSGAYTGFPPGRTIGGGEHVDWVIVGGESGPKRRPMEEAWVRVLRDQCVAAGIPFFLKQWGGARPGGEALLDGRPWRDWPELILAGPHGRGDRP